MVWNLREHIATAGIRRSISGNFGLTVNLKYPDGSDQNGLKAQILYDKDEVDPESGNLIAIGETQITLVKADLDQEIVPGSKMWIEFPTNPAEPNNLTSFMLNPDKAPINGDSIGFIKVFPKEVEQS